MISLLENVALVLMHVNSSLFSLLDLHDDEVFGLLSVVVIDYMLVSVIDESGSPGTEALREDVSAVDLSTLGI